ncbi:MAG: deaminated glutathione amidase [Bacillota bacterium]|nr:deaminated glutathione amidase [Bacillota bacterium]
MRLGVAQMFIADSIEKNASTIHRLTDEAARRGIALLAFPEMSLTGYNPEVLGSSTFKEDLDRAMAELRDKAKERHMGLIVGRADFVGDLLFNAATVILPDGREVTYHKIHLTAAEEKYFTAGKDPAVFEFRERKFGVIICRDQNFPELARDIASKEASALFILSAHYYSPQEARWKVEKNRALPIARAVENHFHVLLANAVGSHIGLISLGNSLIADPEGALVALADEASETILTCDLP